MNPASVGTEDKQQKLQREEETPQQKLHSALKTNVKSLKQGIKSVMNGNRLGKPMVGPIFKERSDKDKITPEDSDNTETDELNPEDLETIPRVVDDKKDETMDESAKRLRGSFHKQQEQRLIWQDSPRGPQELTAGAGNTAATAAHGIPLGIGSDTNILLGEDPLSPIAAPSLDGGLNHPHSAPQQLHLSPGMSPGRNTQNNKNNKFLRGKIKISALKNFVGAGLDLGNSSNNQSGKNHQTSARDKNDEEGAVDHTRRGGQDDLEEEFASPQPLIGPGRKIANKMRNSIMGFKNLAKANRNAAAVLLEDDTSGSLVEVARDGEDEPRDVFDVADSDSTPPDSPRVASPVPERQEEMIDQGVAQTASTAENFVQEKEEAKQRRREKHHQRRVRHMDGSSDHASTPSETNELVSAPTSSAGPPLQRKKTKGKLDAQARERLKKHSEGRDFRNRTTTANRRRRQKLASRVSERNLDTSDNTSLSDLPDLVPVTSPPKSISRPTLSRASSAEAQQRSSRRLIEAQSGRRPKREEDEKLRERVRSRQSFISAHGPKKEASFSLLDLLDKKEEEESPAAEDINKSVAPKEEIGQAASTIFEDSEESVGDVLEKGKNNKSSGYMADTSSAHQDSSSGLNASSSHDPEPTNEGNLQHVESQRSDDYLQLIIGSVPAKASSPTQEEAEAASSVRQNSPRREKRLSRKGSRRSLTDASMEASEPRRTKTGSRARGEKREPSSRRKPRVEKSSRPRDRSPRRKSDVAGLRRQRKGPPRGDTGHASEPVLSAVLDTDNDGTSTVDHASEFELSVMDTSSRSPTDGHATNGDSHEGGESGVHVDASLQSYVDGNEEASYAIPDASAEVSVAPSEVTTDALKDSSRRHDGKDCRRRHHKGAKEKRAERKTNRSATSSKHGNSTASTSKLKLNRSGTRGRLEGALKKAPSVRGRSEKPRRESRSNNIERKARRHSTDARKRPSNGSDGDTRSVMTDARKRPSNASDGDTRSVMTELQGPSLGKIKW